MTVHYLSLSHFAAKPVDRMEDRSRRLSVEAKPVGLWVSVDGDDDWESWCTSESWGLDRLAVRHRVTLSPTANILHVSTVAQLDAFHTEYASALLPGRARCHFIDWPRVARSHDGIIIAPYQWSRRLHPVTAWYYGWDCASGCIWGPRAIASIEVIADLMRERAA